MKLLWVLYSRVLERRLHLAASERIERLSYLSREGVQTFLVAGDFGKEHYPGTENLNLVSVPLKYFPVISPLLYGLVLFFFLPFYVLKIRPDFIISDTSTTPFLVWKPFLSKLVGFKVILDIRSTPVTIPGRRRKRLGQISFNFAVWVAKTMFDGMTIVTPMMKKEICRLFSVHPDWVCVLPNGVSDDFLQYREKNDARDFREKLGLSNKFVIIYHGAFRPNGGLLESIEAVELVKHDYPNIVLFLLGVGLPQSLRIFRRAIEEKGVRDNVIIHEPVDYHSVPDYIWMSDVGLVPLPNIPVWRYQQPLKLLEYMAMGKTIIAADSPAHRYVAGKNSNVVYVPDVNPNELAKAIVFAYENRDKLKNWGKVGRETVAKKYAWKKLNEDLVSYLMKIPVHKSHGQGVLA